MDRFQKSIERENDGRYTVSLPQKQHSPQLATNFGLAAGRLNSLLTKLQKDPALLEEYHRIFQTQLEAQIIERAPCEPQSPLYSYTPHQVVIREQHSTTKIKVVYDASAGPKERSRNDCIYKGPILLLDLVGILLRFRTTTTAIIADAEKAFLQVGLKESDRDATRFLWVRNPHLPTGPQNPL